MPRTETVTRCCPKCGSSFRIPLIFTYAPDQHPNDPRFDLGLGLGCPNQFLPQHGPLAVRELRSLVKYRAAPSQPVRSQFWRRRLGALRPHRFLAFDHRVADCDSMGVQS
jgi:hypothetical protein